MSKKSTFLAQLGFVEKTETNEKMIKILKIMVNILDSNKRLGSLRSIEMLKHLASTEFNTNDLLSTNFNNKFSSFLNLDQKKITSSSFLLLCEILKENLLNKDHDDSRVLIFVKERFSAKWLAEQLAHHEIFSKFIPRYYI